MENKYASNEKIRSSILESYNLPHSCSDSDYDELTFLTATLCEVPVAFIGIIEPTKICLKAMYGIENENSKREGSFTQYALDCEKDFIAVNYTENPDLFDNNKWAAGNFRFYAAVLLYDPSGYPLGALNILDKKERILEDIEIKGLKALARQCLKMMEFSKQNHQFEIVQNKLKQKYEELEKFASLVSHDIKSPLANIISLTELLKEENKGKFDEETTQYLNYLVESSYSLRNYVDGILSFYRSEHILDKDYENVDLRQILQQIAQLYEVADDVILEYPETATLHNVNKAALTQVFLNLISNGLKYNQKKIRRISIDFKEYPDHYYFEVKDNGEGFPEENADKIFELFTTLDTTDREGNPGSGIGLATVQKLVKSMGGEINVSSTPGEGSSFSFTIRRV